MDYNLLDDEIMSHEGEIPDIDIDIISSYTTDDRLSELFNRSRLQDEFEVSQSMLDKYKGTPIRIIKDIQIYTRLCQDLMIDETALSDAKELETYRRLKEGTLSKRGVFYSEGIQHAQKYPILRHSSFVSTINDSFTGRYMLPIKFPDGDVYTWIGHDPMNKLEKYKVQKVSTERRLNWIKQGNLLGNLESLEMYGPVDDVFVVEGLYDAYQINNRFNKPAISLLGSKIYQNKQTMLNFIKDKYRCRFIYVPDFDEAGLDPYLINSPLWDDVYNYNEGQDKQRVFKDVDAYLRDNENSELVKWGFEKYL